MNNSTQRSVFSLLNAIRARPGMYLDGERSLIRLRSFISGYEAGLAHESGNGFIDGDRLGAFQRWLARRWGIPVNGKGWSMLIAERSPDDQAGFELFFTLLDEFAAETSDTI